MRSPLTVSAVLVSRAFLSRVLVSRVVVRSVPRSAYLRAHYAMAALLVTTLVIGCSSQRPQDVWAMPNMRPESSQTSAQQRDGYPFGLYGSGVAGGDVTTDDDEVGDLPEEGYLAKRRGFWRVDEAAAVREAKRTGRRLLVSFWADWSDECVRLDRDTFRVPAVRAEIFGGYVPLRIDVSEETLDGRIQLERYRVDHVPAVILLDGDGRELLRMDDFVSEERMLEHLRSRTPH